MRMVRECYCNCHLLSLTQGGRRKQPLNRTHDFPRNNATVTPFPRLLIAYKLLSVIKLRWSASTPVIKRGPMERLVAARGRNTRPCIVRAERGIIICERWVAPTTLTPSSIIVVFHFTPYLYKDKRSLNEKRVRNEVDYTRRLDR